MRLFIVVLGIIVCIVTASVTASGIRRFHSLSAAERGLDFMLVDALEILPQRMGPRILINRFTLSRPGFLIVRRTDRSDDQKSFVSPIYPPGPTRAGVIDIPFTVVPGETYIAFVVHDDGDKRYSLNDDHIASDQNGELTRSFYVK